MQAQVCPSSVQFTTERLQFVLAAGEQGERISFAGKFSREFGAESIGGADDDPALGVELSGVAGSRFRVGVETGLVSGTLSSKYDNHHCNISHCEAL